MSVLFVMPNWAAVSELWMQRMIEALEPHVAAIACYSPTATFWRGRIPTLALDDAPLRGFGLAQRLGLPINITHSQLRLTKALKSDSVTAVLVNYLDMAMQFKAILKATDKPVFVHCHGYDVMWNLRKDEAPYEQLYYSPEYITEVCQLSQRVKFIANSQLTARKLTDVGVPTDRISVKYYGVPVPDEPMLRVANDRGLHILYLGRLCVFKGPDLVIRAFEIACDRGLNAHLTMAGDGELRLMCHLLKARSKHGDRITLLGAVDATTGDRLRAKADMFTAHNCISPIYRDEEALGVSIVEAMAAALPIISGRTDALTETVVSGETGILVEPTDVEAHADAFLELAKNPKRRLQIGEAGWQRAKNKFSSFQEREKLWSILGLEPSKQGDLLR